MSNPVLDGLNITDKWGTQLSDLGLHFRYPLFRPWVWQWAIGADFVMTLVVTAAGFALALLDLIVKQGLFIGALGRVYQAGLEQVYHLISPLYIASIGFVIVMFRIWSGLKPETNSDGRIIRIRMDHRTFFDHYHSNNSMFKQMIKQVVSAGLMLGMIAFLMANPFLIIKWIFTVVSNMATSMTGSGSGNGSASSVDGVIEPLMQMVNYKSVLSDACSQAWSQTLASGGSTENLSCLTGAQHSATTPDVTTLLTAIMGIVTLAGLCWFAWWIFVKGSFFYIRVMYHVAEIPWRLAVSMFRPGEDRHKLNSFFENIRDAIGAAAWLIAALFLAIDGPQLLMQAAAGLSDSGVPPFWQLMLVSLLYGGAGYAVKRWFGKRFVLKRDPVSKKMYVTAIAGDSGTTGWKDFWQNNSYVKKTRTYAGGLRDSAASTAAAGVVRETTQAGGVTMSPEEEKAINEATSTVKLNEPAPSAVMPVGIGRRAGSGATIFTIGAHHQLPVVIPGAAIAPAAAAAAAAAGAAGGRHHLPDTGVPAGAAAAAAMLAASHGLPSPAFQHGLPGAPATAGPQAVLAGPAGENPAGGAVVPTEVLSPEQVARQQVSTYRANIRARAFGDGVGAAMSPDEAAAVAAALEATQLSVAAWSQLDEITAAALHRHQESLDAASEGMSGSDAGFLARQMTLAQWEQMRILARVLGVRLDTSGPIADFDAGQVFLDGVDKDGNNVIEIGSGKGFGDHI